jgi:hypothetical protein
MNRSRRCAVTATLLLLATGTSRLAAQERAQTFQGEIQVREVGLVVEPPEGGVFQPKDLLVFEDGAPRQVIKTEPLRPEGKTRPWSLVLYVDRVLAAPETVHDAALALSRQARGLTGLGAVEVAVADPEPRLELAATTDAGTLSDTLGALAERVRRERRSKPDKAPDAATLRRQLDRLVAFLAGRPASGARALFLVADGFVPPAGEADLLSAPEAIAAAPPGTATAALRETSRALASAGWVTFAVPYRETPEQREREELTAMERIRVQAGGSEHTNSAPPVIPMAPPRRPLQHESVSAVFTRPDAAPLMALVQPTAGTLLGVEEQIRPAIDDLAARWRVWYQAPESLDGKLRLVEARLPSARTALRSPRWARSTEPEGLAAARARLLAGGAAAAGGTLSLQANLQGHTLHLRLAAAGAGSAGPVRLTVAWDNRSEVRQVVVPEVSLEKGWEQQLELQPVQGARRIGVVVNDLAHDRWGGAALEAPGASR